MVRILPNWPSTKTEIILLLKCKAFKEVIDRVSYRFAFLEIFE